MTTLTELAGIPIEWNADHTEIIFDERLSVKETKTRKRGDLLPVVEDDVACKPTDAVQYWMYNGITLLEHADSFAQNSIQYELTLLHPQRLGRERSKTFGHIHTFPSDRESRVNYAEVCEVLAGEAIFLMQTLDLDNRLARHCVAVRAKVGDKVILPPNTHHLTINASNEPLLFSDLISVHTRGDYSGMSAMHGAAYLYTDEWIANQQYQHFEDVGELELIDAIEYPALNLTREVPLYELIWRSPDLLGWLDDPDSFQQHFQSLWWEWTYY